MSELTELKKELCEIKYMLSQLLRQSAPFSLSANEKAQIMAEAIKKSEQTGDRSYVRKATAEINA